MRRLDVLREPLESLAVALAHDDRAHEDLDGPHTLHLRLALAGGLVEAQPVAELILGDRVGVVDLVAETRGTLAYAFLFKWECRRGTYIRKGTRWRFSRPSSSSRAVVSC